MKTLTKRKSLMGFIYALVMLLPFSAILVRCLYVTFNKNAYHSYSANINYKYNTNQVTNSNDLIYGNIYNFTLNAQPTTWNSVYQQFYCTAIYNVPRYNDIFNCDSSTSTGRIVFRANNTNSWISNADNTNNTLFNLDLSTATYPLTFQVVYDGFPSETRLDYTYFSESTWNVVDYVNNASLDNAFDYSLRTFLEENGTGRLNLTDWFTDVFLNRTTHNMLYLNYVNWYMNYSLLVSCVYLLYSVLMWFLTFARYIINKPLKEEE